MKGTFPAFGAVLGMFAGGSSASSLHLTSSAFAPDAVIPEKFTADGQDKSPPLSWEGIPAKTAELALIVDDPDAPQKEPWVHWVLYNLPPTLRSLPEGVPASGDDALPEGVDQGKNSWGTVGYRGPQPPPGKWHHYRFRLYAVDQPVDLEAGATKEQLLKALKGHVIAETELVGRYRH